jgi:hypothetical protein
MNLLLMSTYWWFLCLYMECAALLSFGHWALQILIPWWDNIYVYHCVGCLHAINFILAKRYVLFIKRYLHCPIVTAALMILCNWNRKAVLKCLQLHLHLDLLLEVLQWDLVLLIYDHAYDILCTPKLINMNHIGKGPFTILGLN